MPERVNSFVPTIPSVFFVFVATIAVHFYSSARAESACIEQPSPPAAEGTHWSFHYDRAKGRKCWHLADANGRDAAASQAQANAAPTPAPAPSIRSQIASLLAHLAAAAANAVSQVNAPQGEAAQINPAGVSRKAQGNAANASRSDDGLRADQKSISEGHAVKRASPLLTEPEREVLFEEFLRWQDNRQSVNTLKPWPTTQ